MPQTWTTRTSVRRSRNGPPSGTPPPRDVGGPTQQGVPASLCDRVSGRCPHGYRGKGTPATPGRTASVDRPRRFRRSPHGSATRSCTVTTHGSERAATRKPRSRYGRQDRSRYRSTTPPSDRPLILVRVTTRPRCSIEAAPSSAVRMQDHVPDRPILATPTARRASITGGTGGPENGRPRDADDVPHFGSDPVRRSHRTPTVALYGERSGSDCDDRHSVSGRPSFT